MAKSLEYAKAMMAAKEFSVIGFPATWSIQTYGRDSY